MMFAFAVAALLILCTPLCSCGYVSQTEMDECRATLVEQQQTMDAQQKQIAILMEEMSSNRIRLQGVDLQCQELEIRVQGLRANAFVPDPSAKANVRIGLFPPTAECSSDSAAWAAVLTETNGVGVTFSDLIIWYRVFKDGGCGANTYVAHHSSSTDPEVFPLRLAPHGTVEYQDLGVTKCFTEQRHYYHAFFGRDDSGNDVVVAGKVIVNG